MYDHLSLLAQRLGRYMAEQCTDGLPGHFGDELLDAFPNESPQNLNIALSELKADNLVELTPVMNAKLPIVRTTYELFVATDPAITGSDPTVDSKTLATMLITNPELGHVPDLEQAAGWPRRRFNPALGLLVQLFPKGRYREVIQNMYPTLGLLVGGDEIVALQRYIA